MMPVLITQKRRGGGGRANFLEKKWKIMKDKMCLEN
jgi:hypothetical protein